MKKLVKDNIIYIIAVFVFLIGGISLFAGKASELISSNRNLEDIKISIKDNENKLADVKRRKKEEEIAKSKKSEIKSGKIIYEVSGQQFSPEASFGIMFENILTNVTSSGLRIRSIDYNYHPNDDKILVTNVYGYNACELSFTTVSNYTQLQNFFKSLTKEKYLSSLWEVYIEPYDKDKSILITRFKVRLYTKTI